MKKKKWMFGLAIFGGALVAAVLVLTLIPEKHVFDPPFEKKGICAVTHSVEIRAEPEEIWNYLTDVEANYMEWHPEDHILFQWTKGAPWAEGSELYSEQVMNGQIVHYKGRVTESIENEKITFVFSFPISLINPKNEFHIEDKGDFAVLTGVTYLRFGKLNRLLNWRDIEDLIRSIEAHTSAENLNMKRILESR